MSCAICDTRKPKRFCLAKETEICTVCCATGRENSIDCPLTCDYLRAAHRHERPESEFDIATSPNRDIKITDAFIEQFQVPLALIATALADAAISTGKATDQDAREALEGMIRRYRGSGAGLVIDSSSPNPYAQAIEAGLQKGIDVFLKLEGETVGQPMTDDSDILKMLVFLQRLEFANNNGRRLSRAFLDFIHGFRMPLPEAASAAE